MPRAPRVPRPLRPTAPLAGTRSRRRWPGSPRSRSRRLIRKRSARSGAGPGGGPHVSVCDGKTGIRIFEFYAQAPHFTGGVPVAGGDVNGDGFGDVIAGAGQGGGPSVQVFSGRNLAKLMSFYAYGPTFAG